MRINKPAGKAAALLACIMLLTGCSTSESTTISVQSVSMLCGLSSLTQSQMFAGVVNTGKEQSIPKDSTRRVAKVAVEKGDYVEAGAVLFTYDAESAQNALERSLLELEEKKNTIAEKEEEKKGLEEDKKKAPQKEQLDYALKIQQIATDLREENLNYAIKEKEIKKLEDATKDLDVVAPFSGMIVKAGTADVEGSSSGDDEDVTFDYSSSDNDASAFIKIIETDNYRIKGTINEQNVNNICNGMMMTIYSRLDNTLTWEGTITEIDLKSTENSQNNDFYDMGGSDEMTSSSKYAFYVSIDDLDGLIVGQHVYMMQADENELEEEIRLDASFINDPEGSPWIWAESPEGVLEKRSVTLDDYDEFGNTWRVASGLDAEDYIAPNSDACAEGLTCIENNNSAFGSGTDEAVYEGGEEDYIEDEEFAEFGDEGDFDDLEGEEFEFDADELGELNELGEFDAGGAVG